MLISVLHAVKELGLRYSGSFNFHGQAHHETVVANRTASMIRRAFRTQDYRLIIFKSHDRPHLKYCPIIYTRLRKVDRMAMENVKRAFTRSFFGPSSILS